uniref:Uncharacterized protein n=1 Tax=Branchiostoma floridae TaxID=7739 RepID=C3XZA0_BRAFL|eukprot:XP_002610654.1 hypothetical protein BRAFLDRAFT_117894 [Branchiostoma floridae]
MALLKGLFVIFSAAGDQSFTMKMSAGFRHSHLINRYLHNEQPDGNLGVKSSHFGTSDIGDVMSELTCWCACALLPASVWCAAALPGYWEGQVTSGEGEGVKTDLKTCFFKVGWLETRFALPMALLKGLFVIFSAAGDQSFTMKMSAGFRHSHLINRYLHNEQPNSPAGAHAHYCQPRSGARLHFRDWEGQVTSGEGEGVKTDLKTCFFKVGWLETSADGAGERYHRSSAAAATSCDLRQQNVQMLERCYRL